MLWLHLAELVIVVIAEDRILAQLGDYFEIDICGLEKSIISLL